MKVGSKLIGFEDDFSGKKILTTKKYPFESSFEIFSTPLVPLSGVFVGSKILGGLPGLDFPSP
jgi:hypothetical protein